MARGVNTSGGSGVSCPCICSCVVHPSSMSGRMISNYMLSSFRLSILSFCDRDAFQRVRQTERLADVSESYVPSLYRLR